MRYFSDKGEIMNVQQSMAAVVRRILRAAVFVMLGAAASKLSAAPTQIAAGTIIPVFALDRPLTEIPSADELPLFGPPGISLHTLVTRMAKAAGDPAVSSIVLLLEGSQVGPAQTEELLAAIKLVRSRNKDVYAFADTLTMGDFILAAGASRISVVPTGTIMIPGLQSSSLHIRALLDKIGVTPDFVAEGAYKSAAELFTREQPSAEADEMMNWLLDSLYSSSINLIADGRSVTTNRVQEWLDKGLFTAEQAKSEGMIDAVEHHADFEGFLKQRYGQDALFDRQYGVEKEPELDLSSPLALLKIWGEILRGPQKKPSKTAVAIVYVEGPIMTGSGSESLFGSGAAYSTDIRKALQKAAQDDSIRAVVLRINSPGGSATASEIILDATRRVKSKKPLVVSMGDVAGSGGYYVACAADTVFADAETLTGSIGVLGGKLATTEMWKKLGVTFKEYKRGDNAGMFSTESVFTDSERARFRLFLDDIYSTFTNHVLEIRGERLKRSMDALAGGRVFTGKQALELGLVDRMGTLRDAVAYAAEQARVTDYETRVVPEPKGVLEQLIEEISGSGEPAGIRAGAGESLLLKLAAPHLQNLDPRRTSAVISALARLEILRREGVVLSMPGIQVNN